MVLTAEAADRQPSADEKAVRVTLAASAQSGAPDPELSVVSIGTTPALVVDHSFASVSIDADRAVLEVTVVNIDKTGPVTIAWDATYTVHGVSDPDLAIKIEHELRPAPSRAVNLPVKAHGPDADQRMTIFTVDASVDERTAGAGLVIDPVETPIKVTAAVEGRNVDVPAGGATIPWRSGCEGGRCKLRFDLVMDGDTPVRLDAGDQGSVTAVGRWPAETETWVELPAQPILSRSTVRTVEVEMPASEDPLADQALLVARLPAPDDPINGPLNCFAPVDYAINGGFESLVRFVGEQRSGKPIELEPGRPTRIELRIGTTDPGQYCDVDQDTQSVVAIGVVTFGLAKPEPALVRVR
jgi:hypothetical protein